jgi:Ala-tRNA(Pro) deacylase
MAIAPKLQKYLADQKAEYDVIAHDATMSSTRTAQACHVSGNCLAKGVVLRTGNGYVLAVVPASHHIRLSDLGREFGPDVGLASEEEIQRLFPDCARGAVPALGQCYGLNVMVDASIEEPAEVYLEGGDHASLIHMSRTQFAKLMAPTRHGRFSMHG